MVACDDPAVPEEIFGTYQLVAVDNSTLPAIAGVNQAEECTTTVQSGTLTIDSDESLQLVINGSRTACNSGTPATSVTFTLNTEWLELRRDSLVFDPTPLIVTGCTGFGVRPVAALTGSGSTATIDLGMCAPVTLKQYRFQR
ncbi:MAG TPA: hypothetical protein VFO52_13575 [Longimicrobiales bacterium]|nr:hypothetical protein [Longimicrobiales bacterium]